MRRFLLEYKKRQVCFDNVRWRPSGDSVRISVEMGLVIVGKNKVRLKIKFVMQGQGCSTFFIFEKQVCLNQQELFCKS